MVLTAGANVSAAVIDVNQNFRTDGSELRIQQCCGIMK